MKKAVGYIRVSTSGQEDKTSPEVQKDIIKENIDAMGYNFLRFYDDAKKAASGYTSKRTNFNLMIEDARQGKFTAIFVTDLSRFGRDHKIRMKNLWLLDEIGVEVWKGTTKVDLNDPKTYLLESIDAYADSEKKKEEISKSKTSKKFNITMGIPQSRAPFGYRNKKRVIPSIGREVAIFEIVEQEKELVEKIFKRRAKNESKYHIAKDMNLGLVKVSRILKNKTYCGYFYWLGKWHAAHPECIPKIIPEEVWEKVNKDE